MLPTMQLFGLLIFFCCQISVIAKTIQLSDGVLTASFNADTTSVNFGSVTALSTNDVPSSVANKGDINTIWSVDVQHIQHTKTNQPPETLHSNTPSATRSLGSTTATTATAYKLLSNLLRYSPSNSARFIIIIKKIAVTGSSTPLAA